MPLIRLTDPAHKLLPPFPPTLRVRRKEAPNSSLRGQFSDPTKENYNPPHQYQFLGGATFETDFFADVFLIRVENEEREERGSDSRPTQKRRKKRRKTRRNEFYKWFPQIWKGETRTGSVL